MTEEQLREIEAAGGLGRFTDSTENAIVLDLVAEIRRLQEPEPEPERVRVVPAGRG